ncbi:MAG: response regulator, partial [Bacillota bacterium]
DIRVIGEANTGEEAVRLAERLRPDIVLMEIDLPKMDGIAATAAISERLPDTGVIICGSEMTPDYLRRAMSAGAREFLTKPLSSGELAETIRRVYRLVGRRAAGETAVAARPAREVQGKLIALYSLKGGVGRTTIGCNLAVGLARETRRKIALVDLDLLGGDVATMLNIDVSGTIVDLLQEEELDQALVDSYLVPHISGVKVLPAPAVPWGTEAVTPERVQEVLLYLKEGYDYVVVDTAPTPDPLLQAVLDEAGVILIPVTQDLVSVKRTRAALDWLTELRTHAEVRLVLNQAGMENGIKIPDFEKSLGSSFTAIVPLDDKVVRSAANKGQPFTLGHTNARVARTILQLAADLAGTGRTGGNPKWPRF